MGVCGWHKVAEQITAVGVEFDDAIGCLIDNEHSAAWCNRQMRGLFQEVIATCHHRYAGQRVHGGGIEILAAEYPNIEPTAKLVQIGHSITVAVFARIKDGVAIAIEFHIELNLVVVRDHVSVAVDITFVRNTVPVHVGAYSRCDVQHIWQSVFIAVGLTLVGYAI